MLQLRETANMYGRPRAGGVTEQVLGDWFAGAPGRRDKVVLATKLYGGKGEWPNDRFLSAVNIRRSCEDSLRRLGTDHIDLYQMHHVDRSTPWEEIWEAMSVLRTQGKIIYVGSSNFAGWPRPRRRPGRSGCPAWSASSCWTTWPSARWSWRCSRRARGTASGCCPGARCTAACWPACCAGRRGRPPLRGPGPEVADGMRDQLTAYEEFCTELGEEPAVVGLAWLLHQPAVAAPIVGPRTLEQFEGALRALKVDLDEAALARLDTIFPGPGGSAPEAYAW